MKLCKKQNAIDEVVTAVELIPTTCPEDESKVVTFEDKIVVDVMGCPNEFADDKEAHELMEMAYLLSYNEQNLLNGEYCDPYARRVLDAHGAHVVTTDGSTIQLTGSSRGRSVCAEPVSFSLHLNVTLECVGCNEMQFAEDDTDAGRKFRRALAELSPFCNCPPEATLQGITLEDFADKLGDTMDILQVERNLDLELLDVVYTTSATLAPAPTDAPVVPAPTDAPCGAGHSRACNNWCTGCRCCHNRTHRGTNCRTNCRTDYRANI